MNINSIHWKRLTKFIEKYEECINYKLFMVKSDISMEPLIVLIKRLYLYVMSFLFKVRVRTA